jgi:hypothetical protein
MDGKNRTPEEILEEVVASMDESGVAAPVMAEDPALAELDGLDLGDDSGRDDVEFGAGVGGDELPGDEDLEAGLPSDEGAEVELEGEDGEGAGNEGGESFEDDEDEDDEDAPIVAFATIEQELEAVASRQGLDRIPQGVVASGEALVDYLLATGAIIELELPKIGADAVATREAAFAAFEQSELLALADELDAIGDDLAAPADENEEEVELPTDDQAIGGDEPAAPAAPAAEPAAPAAPAEEPVAPAAEPAQEPKAEGEACMASATAQRFHPVADAEMVATASAQDVQLVFAHTGENPRYNVIIAGVPAAVITWAGVRASGTSEAAFASFCSADYSRNIVSTMSQQGVGTVLAALNAEFYANAYTQSDLATQIQASVHQELAADYQARVIATRDQLLDMGNLALAGLGKGYFKTPNPMHAHAVQILAAEGVLHPERVALALSEALPETFAVAMAKAVEFMDRSPEFVEQTRESIGEMSPRLRVGASEAPVAPAAPVSASTMTLAQRLGTSAMASAAPVAPAAPTIATANARPSSVNDWHARLQGRIHLGARQ